MTSNLKSSHRRHPTCEQCGDPRSGHAWKSVAGHSLAVCTSCKRSRRQRLPCPRKCGTDGLYGPACRYSLSAPGVPHDGICRPAGAVNRQLQVLAQLQAQRHAEAIHG